MFSLNRLALLLEFQRRGTLLEVSRALSFSPSTVSQQIKVLEREAGTPLIERYGRRLRLTREGELLANRAATILSELELAESELASARTQARGTIRMAAFQTFAIAALPRTLELLAESAPDLAVVMKHIDPHDALNALIAREFDVVVGEEYPGRPVLRPDGVEMRTILSDPLLLALHRSVEPALNFAEIAGSMPWVSAALPANGRQWMVATCRSLDIEPHVQFESPDLLVHLRLAESGHAIAVLPRLLFESERPAIRTLSFPGLPARRIFVAFRHQAGRSPATMALVDALSRSVAQ